MLNLFHCLQLPNITNAAHTVLVSACLLKNYPWSRENTTDSDVLFAMKEAIMNNSCSWVNSKIIIMRVYLLLFSTSQLSSSLGQSFSCDDLSAYCREADVMGKIQNMLYSTLKETFPQTSYSCTDWINANLHGYSDNIQNYINNTCQTQWQ